MNVIEALINALSKVGNIENERKLTPAENLQKKLYLACLDGRNRILEICRRMPELIANGLSNTTFTEMSEFELDEYYQTHGYLTYNVSFTGFPLSPPDVIFTDPKSQAYCVQSLYRDLLIPQPRPAHDYPQNNIWELLKFRLEADTFFCTVKFPKFFKPSDIAYRMGVLLTGNPKPNNKKENPLHALFSIIFNTFVELTQTFANMSLKAAGAEILETMFQNKSMNNISSEIIKRNLQNISRVHLLLATEPVRLDWADMLEDVPTIEKLWAVARTSFCEIRFILDILRKITPATYLRIFFENEHSFDLIPDNDLRTIDFLIAATGNVTQALSWFSPCYFEIPVFNEDLERTFIGNQMIDEVSQFVTMHLTSYRDSSSSQLSITKRNLTPNNQIEKFFTYKPLNIAPQLSLTEPAKAAINTAGKMNFMLSCKQAYLRFDTEEKLSIKLGRIERPKLRTLFEHRVPRYISSILEKNFEEDISQLFIQNSTNTTTAFPINTYQLLLQSANMDPVMFLNFYDSCERLSPLSPNFQPTNEHDYTIDFGYDLWNIHNGIFQTCTLQNAIWLLTTFNVTYAIQYMGKQSLLERCQRLAFESGRTRFHDLVSDYMPTYFHQVEHGLEDRVGPPSMLPLMLLTFSMALSLLAVYTRCSRKKANPRTAAGPDRMDGRQGARLPDPKETSITIAGRHSRQFFTPKIDRTRLGMKPTAGRPPVLIKSQPRP